MKKSFLLVFLLCFSGISFTQTTFLLIDKNAKAVKGVEVSRNGEKVGKTNRKGKIQLVNLIKGEIVYFSKDNLNFTYHVGKSEKVSKEIIEFDDFLLPFDDNIRSSFPDPVEAPPPVEEPKKEEEIHVVVDEIAEFPGGVIEMQKWIRRNLKYPESGKVNGIQGKSIVRLIVETDGAISSVQLYQGLANCPDCDKEALRLFRAMPAFTPSMIMGKPVRSYVVFPVEFKIE